MPDPSDMTPDAGDPTDVLEQLEPEVADGPLGIPFLKPKGAPDLGAGGLESPGDLEDL